MVTAAIDVHKQVLHAVVLDGGTRVFVEERLRGRGALADWAVRWRGRVSVGARRRHARLPGEAGPGGGERLPPRPGRWGAGSPPRRAAAGARVALYLRLLETPDVEVAARGAGLRRFARKDRRCRALEGIFG